MATANPDTFNLADRGDGRGDMLAVPFDLGTLPSFMDGLLWPTPPTTVRTLTVGIDGTLADLMVSGNNQSRIIVPAGNHDLGTSVANLADMRIEMDNAAFIQPSVGDAGWAMTSCQRIVFLGGNFRNYGVRTGSSNNNPATTDILFDNVNIQDLNYTQQGDSHDGGLELGPSNTTFSDARSKRIAFVRCTIDVAYVSAFTQAQDQSLPGSAVLHEDIIIAGCVCISSYPQAARSGPHSITSVQDNGGSAELICTPALNANVGAGGSFDWVGIEGSTNYNGRIQITAIDGTRTQVTIDTPFVGTDGGSFFAQMLANEPTLRFQRLTRCAVVENYLRNSDEAVSPFVSGKQNIRFHQGAQNCCARGNLIAQGSHGQVDALVVGPPAEPTAEDRIGDVAIWQNQVYYDDASPKSNWIRNRPQYPGFGDPVQEGQLAGTVHLYEDNTTFDTLHSGGEPGPENEGWPGAVNPGDVVARNFEFTLASSGDIPTIAEFAASLGKQIGADH